MFIFVLGLVIGILAGILLTFCILDTGDDE